MVNDVSGLAWTRRDGVELRRFTQGSGPGIVLLPPHGRGPGDFDALAPLLAQAGLRVIRPEPRGFGRSTGPLDSTLADLAQDVAAAIEAEGGAPVVVAGVAYGNRVARMLAVLHPTLVRGLVLIAAGGRFPPSSEAAAKLRLVQDREAPLERREEAARAGLFGAGCALTLAEMRLDDIAPDALRAQPLDATRCGPLDFWWPGGTAPMLVIQGVQDVLAPPENGRSLQQDFPDRVTLLELPEAGHRMAQECPGLVAHAISSWLRSLQP